MQIAGKFLMLFKISYIYKVCVCVCMYIQSDNQIPMPIYIQNRKTQIKGILRLVFRFSMCREYKYSPNTKKSLKTP